MEAVIATYGFRFGQPWWLAAGLLAAPMVYYGWRNLASLGPARRVAALALRAVVAVLLAAILARPMITRTSREITLIAVLDRSRSVPADRRTWAVGYLAQALKGRGRNDRFALVDVAEDAWITRLPGAAVDVPERNTTLSGQESRLEAGLQMALAIAPPDTATRLLLISDGNETAGDLMEAARTAAANKIPIDVLPLRYHYEQEVVFRRLVAPPRARSGQPITLRMVLQSTAPARGRIQVSLNGKPLALDPAGSTVELPGGTKVHTMSLQVGTRGVHQYEAVFVPLGPGQDRLAENNQASAITYVAGPGHVLVVHQKAPAERARAAPLVAALAAGEIDARTCAADELTASLTGLMDTDAIVMVNLPRDNLSYAQEDMLCRYVTELGGGLVMIGGPDAFGAGGWISSPVAEIFPVDMDPPQKKQMPRGALVLIMHACEMPQGNLWGKRVGEAAVKALSRLDLVGIQDYQWQAGQANWVYPLSPVGDRRRALAAIKRMSMGDMPDLHAPVAAALAALTKAQAGQRHIIVITDGDPNMPSQALAAKLRAARITCSTVGVFPHSPADFNNLRWLAQATGGRFYPINQAGQAQQLPQIFIKEAQVVRRGLIVEQTFAPKRTDTHEIMDQIAAVPALDGYILTGPKGGLNKRVLAGANGEDPILATCQSGLGRCLAFTSSADAQWARQWVSWERFKGFWQQAVRWCSRSPQGRDCEVFSEVQGRRIALNIEAATESGQVVPLSNIHAKVIAPDMSAKELPLEQIGPGQYRTSHRAGGPGSYLVNVTYLRPDKQDAAGPARPATVQSVVNVPFAPEYEDLTDNAPLLKQVADRTGGRVLGADAAKVKLFDTAGTSFPQAFMPLTKYLLLAWIVLFLHDVAVRRIVVDFKALARRVVGAARLWRRAPPRGETLDRLMTARQKVRRTLQRDEAEAVAAKRYEPPAGALDAAELPMADLREPQPPQKPAAQPEAPAAPPTPAADTHVSRLLKAKKQARDRMEGDR